MGTTFSVTIFGLTTGVPVADGYHPGPTQKCRIRLRCAARSFDLIAGRARVISLTLVFLLLALMLGPPSASAREGQAGPFRVAATIKPVHSLVAAIMRGVGRPLLVFPRASGLYGDATLPAAIAEKLQHVDLIFRVGPLLEERLNKTIDAGAKEKAITLMRAAGVRLIDVRPGHRRVGAPRVRPKASGGRARVRRIASGKKLRRGSITFRTRDGRKVITTRRRKSSARRSQRRAARRSGARRPAARRRAAQRGAATQKTAVTKPDPNIWLDPRNAIAMARAISKTLIARDPDNARLYRRNVAALIVALEALEADITGLLRPLRTSRFAVLNNRLQYFEENFLLRPTVELKLNLTALTAEKAAAIGKQLKGGAMRCILAPTGAGPALVQAMQPGGKRKVLAVDPFGDGFDAGPKMYETMMRAIGETYGRCLALGEKPATGRKKANAKKTRDPAQSKK